MSRELKFKVWDNEYKEYSNWTNRDPFFSVSHDKLFFWERTQNEDGEYSGDIILEDHGDRFTLLQYTGLKDKNGVEIYEGDILKIYNHDRCEAVSYEAEGSSAFGFWKHDNSKRDGGIFEPLGNWTGDDGYEVIGNLFENPELLEQ
jgi:uncharacterized phage protein (TIGR01671 family)